MGRDYSASLIVGFHMDAQTFLKPLVKEVPEEVHYEDRWDPKTGKKLEPKKVANVEAGEYYVYEDVRYESDFDAVEGLLEVLSGRFDCHMFLVGEYGDLDCCRVAIEPIMGSGSIGSNDYVNFADVNAAGKETAALGKRLKRAGFDPGADGVHVDMSVC